MKELSSLFTRVGSGIVGRIRRSRRGSVLILCVALLVLLALIGTAMISTSRTDRYSSQQNTYNTEIDLLVEGVKAMATGAIVSDLWDSKSGVYRAPLLGAPQYTNTYDHLDFPGGPLGVLNSSQVPQDDRWLASRYPTRLDLNATYIQPENVGTATFISTTANTEKIYWQALTAPLASALGSTALEFESPYVNSNIAIGSVVTQRYTNRTMGCGTYLKITQADGSNINYPALTFPTDPAVGGQLWLAADADGDGIADSGLFRLPIGDLNGVTYYAAVRIIDNNSAINVNTAWSRSYDFNGTYQASAPQRFPVPPLNMADTQTPVGFYRANIGLLELLRSYDPTIQAARDMDDLNDYRWGYKTSSDLLQPVLPQSGFNYADECDAMENGLARRLDNPDVNSGTQNFRAMSLSDQAALAARFCVINPSASISNIEKTLNFSLVSQGYPSGTGGMFPAVSKTRYDASTFNAGLSGVAQWFNDNFNWDVNPYMPAPSGPKILRLPLRSALVARNAVSNIIPTVTYKGGVLVPDTAMPPPNARNLPGMTPYGSVNVKTDINMAGFSELWRAYWSVMADNVATNLPPFPYQGSGDARMFRSSIRNLAAGIATPSEMLQLRSALAAVNAMGLRDGGDNVISREIPLYDYDTVGLAATARVYGTERQPFITEVYVNTYAGQYNTSPLDTRSNPKGYVAIELYNPYPTDLVLNNWALGRIQRQYASPSLSIVSLGSGAGLLPSVADPTTWLALPPTGYGTHLAFLGGGQITIPALKHVILENLPPLKYRPLVGGASGVYPSPNSATDAEYRPDSIQGTANENYCVYVPNLHEVIDDGTPLMGGELVLLRPHIYQRPASSSVVGLVYDASDPTSNLTSFTPLTGVGVPADQTNAYSEGTVASPNLYDFAPIDSYDFTGIAATPPAGPLSQGNTLHYVRRNGAGTADQWRFVYPGLVLPLSAATVANKSRHNGVVIKNAAGPDYVTAKAAGLEPLDAMQFWLDDTHATEVDNFPGIQLCNANWPSYNANTTTFPFGTFPRNGDILQVPFIGGYQLLPLTSTSAAPNVIEENAVTIDCSFVDDQDRIQSTPTNVTNGTRDPADASMGAGDDLSEQLGRFCPIKYDPSGNNGGGGSQETDDYTVYQAANGAVGTYADATLAGSTILWRYHFATKLFDYLTVQSPASDYKPNVNPSNFNVQPVANIPIPAAQANTPTEYTVGVDGLVNINTAPWWIIASLPLLPPSLAGAADSNNGFPVNIENLAKAIVLYRDGVTGNPAYPQYGPFRSIFDLNRVPGFQYAITSSASPLDPDDNEGDISPVGAGADGVRNDFEEQFLMMNRISNLITTRSDTFTVYILVQGWRNAGTATPELVVQRRAAMILDRNNVTGVSGTANPKKTTVVND